MMRAILFNMVYYVGTAVIGVLILPSLILPDKIFWTFIRLYFRFVYVCEKKILGLDYIEVGRENIPLDTSYIVAMKHQSAYETLKLPILFARPIVILKRELLMIPLWGWYAAKAGNVGIDRGNPRTALDRMLDSVKRAVAMGRTPVIFPQGTRVGVNETATQKPYKRGIYEMYQAAQVPVVPVALNSGLFWPRRAFLKRGGCVTFQYLPPIPPGLDRMTFMNTLQDQIESASTILSDQAQKTMNIRVLDIVQSPDSFLKHLSFSYRFLNRLVVGITAIIILYMGGWFYGAHLIRSQIDLFYHDASASHIVLTEPRPRVTGFPFRYHIKWSGTFMTPDVQMSIPRLDVYLWPIAGTGMVIDFPDGIVMAGRQMAKAGAGAISMHRLRLNVTIPRVLPSTWNKSNVQALHDRGVVYRLREIQAKGPVMGDFTPVFSGAGTLHYDQNLQPVVTMNMIFDDADRISRVAAAMIKHPMGQSFLTGAIGALSRVDPKTGDKKLPLTIKVEDTKIYVGPFKIGSVGRVYWPVK